MMLIENKGIEKSLELPASSGGQEMRWGLRAGVEATEHLHYSNTRPDTPKEV